MSRMQRGEVKTKRISSLIYEAVCAFVSAATLLATDV
jgi:hypothetical protein